MGCQPGALACYTAGLSPPPSAFEHSHDLFLAPSKDSPMDESQVSHAVQLAARLKKLSAVAWVNEVDRLARFDSVSIDEVLTLLGRRFAGEYLDRRRGIIWSMLEYVYVRIEPEAWADPGRVAPRRQSARNRKGAAA